MKKQKTINVNDNGEAIDEESQVSQEEVEDLEDKKNNARKIPPPKKRQARVGTILEKCPLCNAIRINAEELDLITSEKFYLLQFGANNDNNGYESYRCDFCNKFFMLVLSDVQVMITPQFTVAPPKPPVDPRAEPSGGGGFAGGGGSGSGSGVGM